MLLNTLVTSCLCFLCSLSVIVGKDIKHALLWLWNIFVKITCFCSPLKTFIYNETSTCDFPTILLRRVPGSNNQACHRQMLMMALLGQLQHISFDYIFMSVSEAYFLLPSIIWSQKTNECVFLSCL